MEGFFVQPLGEVQGGELRCDERSQEEARSGDDENVNAYPNTTIAGSDVEQMQSGTCGSQEDPILCL